MTETVHVVVRGTGEYSSASAVNLRAFQDRDAAETFRADCVAAHTAYVARVADDWVAAGRHPAVQLETIGGVEVRHTRVPPMPQPPAYVAALAAYTARLVEVQQATAAWCAAQPDPGVSHDATYHVETVPFQPAREA